MAYIEFLATVVFYVLVTVITFAVIVFIAFLVFTALMEVIEEIMNEIKGLEARRFTSDDSPKGEFVPGVRYWQLAGAAW